jgi:hypothetical protein
VVAEPVPVATRISGEHQGVVLSGLLATVAEGLLKKAFVNSIKAIEDRGNANAVDHS